MKKIIYSLVIMIAAGSLFTSCIEQVEPEGIRDLREAKARYYDALSQLRAKDGVYREAEAALKLAEAAVQQATADQIKQETADAAKMNELLREKQALENEAYSMEMELRAAQIEAEIDSLQKVMEIREKQHEIDLVDKQRELAQAQETLRQALRDIALAAADLTPKEKAAVIAAVEKYLEWHKKVADQKIVVMEKELALNKAKIAADKADLEWDSEEHEYADALDLLQRDKERAEEARDFYQMVYDNLPAPNVEDLDTWKAELDKYQAEKDELEYSRYKIVQDSAALMVEVHDAFDAYRAKVGSWVSGHSYLGTLTANNGYPLATPDPKKEPKYNEGDITYKTIYEITDKEGVLDDEKPGEKYPAGTVFGNSANIAPVGTLPELKIESTPAFVKFDAQLASFTGIDVDGETRDLYKDGKLTIDNDMYDFILGDSLGNIGTQELKRTKGEGKAAHLETVATADYGLWGAYYTLLRDKVLLEPVTTPKADLEKQLADAKKVWEEHRAVLKAGKSGYKPLTDAIAALEEAEKNESDQIGDMAKAINELKDAFESVVSLDLSRNDSMRIIKAFAAFGKAREEYLEYKNDGKQAINFKYYRYGSSKKGGETIIDSVLFSALSYDDLKKDKYGYLTTDADTRYCGHTESDYKAVDDPEQYALAHIARQLLNKDFADMLLNAPLSWDFTACDLNAEVGSPAHNAFYNEYVFVKGDETLPKTDPKYYDHMETKPGGEVYESPKLTAAKNAVKYAHAKYENIYRMFWAEPYPTDPNANTLDNENEISVEKYSYDTFTKPYNCVTFTGQEVDFSKAIGAILGTVDVEASDQNATNLDNSGTVSTMSAVFGTTWSLVWEGEYKANGSIKMPTSPWADFKSKTDDQLKFQTNRTDFYNLMVAEYRLWLANHPADKDLDVIKKWIESVEAAIKELNAGNADLAKKAYELDKAVYDNMVKNSGTSQDNWTEFAGTYTSGGKTYFCPKINKIWMGDNYTIMYSGLVAGSETVYTTSSNNGKWASRLKGKQLEFANEVLPDFPKKVADLMDRTDEIDDQIAHLDITLKALKDAYFAAAKVYDLQKQFADADGNPATDWDQLKANYEQALKDFANENDAMHKMFASLIEFYDGQVDKAAKDIADFQSKAPDEAIKVAKAQAELDEAKFLLDYYETVFKGIKDDLNLILEYLKSLDVQLVIPNVTIPA